MRKLIIMGLVGALLVNTISKVNTSKNINYDLERVISSEPIKKIKLVGFPKIEFPKIKVQELPKYDESKRLNEETLDEFINFIYKNMRISEVINKKFVKSIVNTESERYVYAKSKVGARGIMQLMPATWNQMEKESDFYKEAFNPNKNIEVGIKYLNWINNYCEKKHLKWNKLSTKDKYFIIAAAYNGGANKLRKRNWDINKMPYETRNYVKKIEKDLNRNN